MRMRVLLCAIECGVLAAVGCGSESNSPHASANAGAGMDGGPAETPVQPPDAAPSSAGRRSMREPSPAASDPAGRGATQPRPGANASAGAGAGGAAAGGGDAPAAGSAADSGKAGSPAPAPDATPTLFYLSVTGQVLRAAADGSQRRVIVQGASAGSGPDGVAVDVERGHVYWTNMGAVSSDDGAILRADLDGKNVTTIVPPGGTFTPKQLKLDAATGKLYWSDREGMRVMRANLDGSKIETLVVAGSGDRDRRDASHWCVGIAVDVAGGKLYWTQKGGDNARVGSIRRANLELPAGQDAATRSDIEILFDGLPEPIDLDLDLGARMLYWSDRGDNTVSRAPLEPPTGFDPAARLDRTILVRGLREAIGISLDTGRNRMFYTAIGGAVGTATLDGSMSRDLLTNQGSLTGIAAVDLPK